MYSLEVKGRMPRNRNIPPEVRKQIRDAQAQDNKPPQLTTRQQLAIAAAGLRRERIRSGGPRRRPSQREFNLKEESLVTLTRTTPFLINPTSTTNAWCEVPAGTTGILLERGSSHCAVLFPATGRVTVSSGLLRDATPDSDEDGAA